MRRKLSLLFRVSPAVPFLVALGFEVSPIDSWVLAVSVWGIAVIWLMIHLSQILIQEGKQQVVINELWTPAPRVMPRSEAKKGVWEWLYGRAPTRGEKILFVVVLVVHVVMMSLGAWVHKAIGMSWVGVLVVANIILFSVKGARYLIKHLRKGVRWALNRD